MHSTQMAAVRAAGLTLAAFALSMSTAFAAPSFKDAPDTDFARYALRRFPEVSAQEDRLDSHLLELPDRIG